MYQIGQNKALHALCSTSGYHWRFNTETGEFETVRSFEGGWATEAKQASGRSDFAISGEIYYLEMSKSMVTNKLSPAE